MHDLITVGGLGLEVKMEAQGARSALEASRLVRYRFETPAQLARHLQLMPDGAGYLFVPEPAFSLPFGVRVVLDVSFTASGERCVLHSAARWRMPRPRGGLWIELPGAARSRPGGIDLRRAGAGLEGAVVPPRRRHRRIATDLIAEVRTRAGEAVLCRVLDLCLRGARLSAAARALGSRGDALAVSILGPQPSPANFTAQAQLAWARPRECAVEFVVPSGAADPGLWRLLQSVQSRWRAAPPLVHPPACGCAEGDLPGIVFLPGLSAQSTDRIARAANGSPTAC